MPRHIFDLNIWMEPKISLVLNFCCTCQIVLFYIFKMPLLAWCCGGYDVLRFKNMTWSPGFVHKRNSLKPHNATFVEQSTDYNLNLCDSQVPAYILKFSFFFWPRWNPLCCGGIFMLLSAFIVLETYHCNFIDVAVFNSFPFLYPPALVLALLNCNCSLLLWRG